MTINKAHSFSLERMPLYTYLGDFRLRFSHDETYADGIAQKPDWCVCDHGDDIWLTFGAPFNSAKMTRCIKFTDEEKSLSENFMKYLTNFAKTGYRPKDDFHHCNTLMQFV